VKKRSSATEGDHLSDTELTNLRGEVGGGILKRGFAGSREEPMTCYLQKGRVLTKKKLRAHGQRGTVALGATRKRKKEEMTVNAVVKRGEGRISREGKHIYSPQKKKFDPMLLWERRDDRTVKGKEKESDTTTIRGVF